MHKHKQLGRPPRSHAPAQAAQMLSAGMHAHGRPRTLTSAVSCPRSSMGAVPGCMHVQTQSWATYEVTSTRTSSAGAL